MVGFDHRAIGHIRMGIWVAATFRISRGPLESSGIEVLYGGTYAVPAFSGRCRSRESEGLPGPGGGPNTDYGEQNGRLCRAAESPRSRDFILRGRPSWGMPLRIRTRWPQVTVRLYRRGTTASGPGFGLISPQSGFYSGTLAGSISPAYSQIGKTDAYLMETSFSTNSE